MKFLGQQNTEEEVFDSPRYWLNHELKAINQEYQWALKADPSKTESLKSLHRQRSIDLQSPEKMSGALKWQEELALIEQLLVKHYELHLKEKDALEEKLRLEAPQPYLRFLLRKRFYLRQKQEFAQGLNSAPEQFTVIEVGGERKWLKILDLTWSSVQNIYNLGVLQLILSGAFGFMLNIGEGFKAARQAYQAYTQEKSRQRKTKIVTGVTNFMLGGAGAGLSLAFLVSFLGGSVALSLTALLPVIIPSILVSIYSLTLWRNSYVYHQWRHEERLLRKHIKEETFAQNALRYDIHALEKKIENLNIAELLQQEKMGKNLSAEDEATKHSYELLEAALNAKQEDFARVTLALEENHKREQHCQEELRLARRETAVGSMEVLSSSLVLVAVILGASALIGASVASFGALPLSLLVLGVVVGVATKLADYYDSTHDYSLSQKCAQWLKPTVPTIVAKPQKPEELKRSSPRLKELYDHLKKEKSAKKSQPSATPAKKDRPLVRFQLSPEQEAKAATPEARARLKPRKTR